MFTPRSAAGRRSLGSRSRSTSGPRLVEDAHTPTLDELLDRAGGRAGGHADFEAATGAVRADRDAR